VLAGLLLLSRFFAENLAAQGYLDISYLALILWAIALEVERPRRGTGVFLVLAAAGLLRPEAWVLSGAYWLWCALPRRASRAGPAAKGESAGRSVRYLALAASAPLIWVLVDLIVTGRALYSLSSTSGLARELGRTQGLSGVITSMANYALRIDKLPVVLGGLAGVALSIWLTPRRVGIPLVALLLLLATFVAEGAVGASMVDRYMLGASAVLLLFCAVTLGGWAMLEPRTMARRAWILAAAALLAYGVSSAATTLNLTQLRTTLAYHEDFHRGLAAAFANPTVKAKLRRCPLVSLPNNKLIPDARWILDSVGQRDIVARSQARADVAKHAHALENRIRAGSVAVYPLGSAVFIEAIVDIGDDPRDQVPLAAFQPIYTSRYYAIYANC
jgi:hypothetical protein